VLIQPGRSTLQRATHAIWSLIALASGTLTQVAERSEGATIEGSDASIMRFTAIFTRPS
jgi:hypothetical protein